MQEQKTDNTAKLEPSATNKRAYEPPRLIFLDATTHPGGAPGTGNDGASTPGSTMA